MRDRRTLESYRLGFTPFLYSWGPPKGFEEQGSMVIYF